MPVTPVVHAPASQKPDNAAPTLQREWISAARRHVEQKNDGHVLQQEVWPITLRAGPTNSSPARQLDQKSGTVSYTIGCEVRIVLRVIRIRHSNWKIIFLVLLLLISWCQSIPTVRSKKRRMDIQDIYFKQVRLGTNNRTIEFAPMSNRGSYPAQC